MTNRQAQVGKFSPARSEHKFNPNWWLDLPSVHPLASTTPARQQCRALDRAAFKPARTVKIKDEPNRKARRTAASLARKAN